MLWRKKTVFVPRRNGHPCTAELILVWLGIRPCGRKCYHRPASAYLRLQRRYVLCRQQRLERTYLPSASRSRRPFLRCVRPRSRSKSWDNRRHRTLSRWRLFPVFPAANTACNTSYGPECQLALRASNQASFEIIFIIDYIAHPKYVFILSDLEVIREHRSVQRDYFIFGAPVVVTASHFLELPIAFLFDDKLVAQLLVDGVGAIRVNGNVFVRSCSYRIIFFDITKKT